MTASGESERVSLGPSGWNYWRPFYMGKAWQAGCLPVPLVLVAVIVHSDWLLLSAFVLSGIAQLLAIRGQRDAFFTPTRVHCCRGLFGLAVEDVPIHQIHQVLVDPVTVLPEMGSITIQSGAKYLQFECVPDAEAKARRILALAEAARERRRKPE